MPKKTGTTNPNITNLINQLKKKSSETNTALWKTIAEKLEKSRRSRISVNISKINRNSSSDEIIVVPGKVLSIGKLEQSVTIAALDFSEKAKIKVKEAKGVALSLEELLEQNPTVSKIRIIV